MSAPAVAPRAGTDPARGPDRTPVVTGLGVVAPTGTGAGAHWRSLLAGRSGIRRIGRFDPLGYPVRLAGQVPDFDGSRSLPGRLLPQTDIGTQMGLVAAEEALRDAGVVPQELPEYELAVVTAASSGGTEFGQHEMEELYRHGPEWVGAYQSIAWFYAATTGQLSIRHGLRGPSMVVCAEQAGGLDALGHARGLVSSGSRLVLAGGADAALCPYGLTAQLTSGWLSVEDDPERAYLPFDAAASGYVPGEGAAMVVAEPAWSASARGARPYGVVLGHASGFDPAPGSGRPPALRRTVEAALAQAGRSAREVDVVFADGAAVPERDDQEADALCAVFGARGVPVTAPKSLTGRLLGGGAALDVATALLAIRYGCIPPTTGTTTPVHELDLVLGAPRRADVDTALVLARGYGGFVSALVLGRAEPSPPAGGPMESPFTLEDLRRLLRVQDADELTADNAGTDFAELGYDSLAVLEFGSQLRRRYGVRIPDDTLLELRTPQQAVDYVNARRVTGVA